MERSGSAGEVPGPRSSGAAIDTLGSAPRHGRRLRLPREAPVYGCVLGAALAVAAPFASVNTLTVRLADGRVRHAGVDGWGRDHPHQALQTVGHGVRFGVALWLCAAGLLVTAVLLALAGRRASSQVARQALVATIAAPAVLAGVTAALWLAAQNYVDTYDALNAARRSSLTGGEATYQAGYGGCGWLALAALVCALSASYGYLRPGSAA